MQQTNLHIATPCHEDWNAMMPSETGKFCASCSKQVIDFTSMSDAQILKFLTAHGSGLCGRFDAGQLSRPLTAPAVSKKKSWYLALALPLALFFQKSIGQKGVRLMGKLAVKTEQKPPARCNVAPGSLLPQPDWITLHGTVKDEKGNTVENASVVIKGTLYGCVTDSAGGFSIKLNTEKDTIILAASFVGCQPVEKKVSLEEADHELALTLTRTEAMLDGVTVTSNDNVSCGRMAGGISMYHTITHAEKRDSAVRKLLRLTPFMVYPNPVRNGGFIQISCKKEGAYEVQLLSSASVLLKTETIQMSTNAATVFQLPPQLAAGMYYLRLISDDRKRSYLEKILVNQ